MDIISTTLTEEQINAFINTAHHVVDANLSATGLDGDLLTDIELWLSAHFLAVRDQRASEERFTDYSVKYQGQSGLGLQSTTYGQQVLALDFTGTLAAMGQKKATLFLV